MNEILTNEEIETLLQMFRTEGTEGDAHAAQELSQLTAEDRKAGPEVRPVDLLKPNRLGRDQLLALERYLESTAKLLSATISDKLRLDVQCDCVAVEQLRFRAWLAALPRPVAIYVLNMEPLPQSCLFTASTSLLYGAVDRILGGSGRVPQVPLDFTEAEYTVADSLLGPCLDKVCQSLAEIVPIQWKVENRFCNPSMANILPGQDVVLSVYFQVTGEFLLGDLRLVFPFNALEPHLGRLTEVEASTMQRGTMREVMRDNCRSVPVEFTVQLGHTEIPLRQLLALRAGDVVPVGTRIGQPLTAPVQGVPKFTGHLGTRGPRMAFKVTQLLEG